MSKEDDIELLFKNLNEKFDVKEPEKGHQMRFLNKLQASAIVVKKPKKVNRNWWKTVSVAATLVALLAVGFNVAFNPKQRKIAKVPTEVQNAQYYFTALIESELEKIEKQTTPNTKKIVEDAMLQLKKLEADYKALEMKIGKNSNTKQLLYAMIVNFQTRIDLLRDVLIEIENVKNIKYELTSV